MAVVYVRVCFPRVQEVRKVILSENKQLESAGWWEEGSDGRGRYWQAN